MALAVGEAAGPAGVVPIIRPPRTGGARSPDHGGKRIGPTFDIPATASGASDTFRVMDHEVADGGRLVVPGTGAERLTDPEYLVNAAPGRVIRLLDSASSPAARFGAAVYRESMHLHRDAGGAARRETWEREAEARHDEDAHTRSVVARVMFKGLPRLKGAAAAGVRRHLLALGAARLGDRELSGRISAVSIPGEPPAQWGVDWSTGTEAGSSSAHVLYGHGGFVGGVATAVVGGRRCIVSGGGDRTVRVRDLGTGEPIGGPLTGETDKIASIATTMINDCPHAVTGGYDGALGLWDLTRREQVGEPLTGHRSMVTALATTMIGGCPHAVTTSEVDGSVRVWDLTTRRQVGDVPAPRGERAWSVAATMLAGRPHVVTGAEEGIVRVWGLTAPGQVGGELIGHTGTVCAMATGTLDGRPHVLTGGGYTDPTCACGT